jgi:hypothetical protein
MGARLLLFVFAQGRHQGRIAGRFPFPASCDGQRVQRQGARPAQRFSWYCSVFHMLRVKAATGKSPAFVLLICIGY